MEYLIDYKYRYKQALILYFADDRKKYWKKTNLLIFFRLIPTDTIKFHYLIEWVLNDRNATAAASSFGAL